jgi:hypothetical protein
MALHECRVQFALQQANLAAHSGRCHIQPVSRGADVSESNRLVEIEDSAFRQTFSHPMSPCELLEQSEYWLFIDYMAPKVQYGNSNSQPELAVPDTELVLNLSALAIY